MHIVGINSHHKYILTATGFLGISLFGIIYTKKPFFKSLFGISIATMLGSMIYLSRKNLF